MADNEATRQADDDDDDRASDDVDDDFDDEDLDPTEERIFSYLSGSLSDDEKRQFERDMDTNPDLKMQVGLLKPLLGLMNLADNLEDLANAPARARIANVIRGAMQVTLVAGLLAIGYVGGCAHERWRQNQAEPEQPQPAKVNNEM